MMTRLARILAAVAAAWPEPASTGGRWYVTVRVHTPEGRLFGKMRTVDHEELLNPLYDGPLEVIVDAAMWAADEAGAGALESSINHAARRAVQESAK